LLPLLFLDCEAAAAVYAAIFEEFTSPNAAKGVF